MKRKPLLIALAILVALSATFVVFFITRKNEPNVTSVSTDPVDYQNCIKAGGKVTNNLAPSYCVLDGKKYSDGNF